MPNRLANKEWKDVLLKAAAVDRVLINRNSKANFI
jgi:hypothetical protein